MEHNYSKKYRLEVNGDFNHSFYERCWNGFTVTGDLLHEICYVDDVFYESTTYVIFKGYYTPYGMCRDCGDHFIIACWDHYNKINKSDMTVEYDVEDI